MTASASTSRRSSRRRPGPTADIVGILKETKTDVVINYLPVGSEEATKWYVEQILKAGCAMVNCVPVFIAREPYWQNRFIEAGVPIIGDDIKSQVGATIVHRVLTRLFRERGVKLERTYQLNVGGNTDFLNMLERERLESKKISKTNAVTCQLDYEMGADNMHIGPSDYVPWLDDRKWATSAWRAAPSATCRSTSNSSSKSWTPPTPPASSSTPCAAPRSPSTAASPARSRAPAATS